MPLTQISGPNPPVDGRVVGPDVPERKDGCVVKGGLDGAGQRGVVAGHHLHQRRVGLGVWTEGKKGN